MPQGDSNGRYITWPQFLGVGLALLTAPIVVAYMMIGDHAKIKAHEGAITIRESKYIVDKIESLEVAVRNLGYDIRALRGRLDEEGGDD